MERHGGFDPEVSFIAKYQEEAGISPWRYERNLEPVGCEFLECLEHTPAHSQHPINASRMKEWEWTSPEHQPGAFHPRFFMWTPILEEVTQSCYLMVDEKICVSISRVRSQVELTTERQRVFSWGQSWLHRLASHLPSWMLGYLGILAPRPSRKLEFVFQWCGKLQTISSITEQSNVWVPTVCSRCNENEVLGGRDGRQNESWPLVVTENPGSGTGSVCWTKRLHITQSRRSGRTF